MSKAKRSRLMSRIRSRDTKPEMIVRRLTHGMGYRYRLHDRTLPGCPDLVFRKRGKVVFVHGCFWHRHAKCQFATVPKSRVEFWEAKLTANRNRDKKNLRKLKKLGWSILVIWECELGDEGLLKDRIRQFLSE